MPEEFIHIGSALDELKLYDFQAEDSDLGETVSAIFDAELALPGVIILQSGKLRGMISRRRFLETLSRAYGRELFLRRPLSVLQGFMDDDILVLSGSTPITIAADLAIKRPAEMLNEPLVVETIPGDYRLLDIHDLLVAQSQIHQLTNQMLQEKAKAEMIHVEKLASLGKLIAGVAHEIRNPVNFIAGNLPYLRDYFQNLQLVLEGYQAAGIPPSPDLQALLEEVDLEFALEDFPKTLASISSGTERLKLLANSLRTFSRPDDNQWCMVDIHQTIDGALLMLNAQIKAGIHVVKDYGDLPTVQGNPNQLGQVFMNLMSNAIDALLEPAATISAGTHKSAAAGALVATCPRMPQITITTRLLSELPEAVRSKSSHPLVAASWLQVSISDNGPGIPEDIQSRIFEDFFTTKPAEKGTGLGLPIAAQIVRERHQGHLILRSPCLFPSDQAASGTQFEVWLPVLPQP